MNSVIAKKWSDALRSGEYAKTTGALHADGGFCALGVLCDVHRKETGAGDWVQDNPNGEICYQTSDYPSGRAFCTLPWSVVLWAGTQDNNPEAPISYPNGRAKTNPMRPLGQPSMAEINDQFGLTFDQIADIIDQHHAFL